MVKIKESIVGQPVNKFYASWDDISTTKAWNRPELYNLIKWRDTLFDLHNGLEGIDLFLVGGFAEYLHNPTNPLTWDADICFVVDESIDYTHIKRILDDSLRIGLDIGILLDQKAVTPYMFQFFQKLWGGVIPEYNNDELVYFKNFIRFIKIINDEVVMDNNDIPKPSNVQITNVHSGLYKVVGMNEKLINKVINKFNEGIYIGKAVDLKNTNFNFKT